MRVGPPIITTVERPQRKDSLHMDNKTLSRFSRRSETDQSRFQMEVPDNSNLAVLPKTGLKCLKTTCNRCRAHHRSTDWASSITFTMGIISIIDNKRKAVRWHPRTPQEAATLVVQGLEALQITNGLLVLAYRVEDR